MRKKIYMEHIIKLAKTIKFALRAMGMNKMRTFLMMLGIFASLIAGWTTELPTSVSLPSVVIAFLFSASTGLFFGIYPAKKASELDPIVALQSE
jgi:ABC-type lipoprotein release transport system permease subunit